MEAFLTFSFLFVSGLVFGSWYGRKTSGFRWIEYIALLILPTFGIFWLVYKFGVAIIFIYLFSALAGTFLEYLVGFSYHKAIGTMLWKYGRLSIQGYTSFLSIPFWGLVGIFFFLFMKALSL